MKVFWLAKSKDIRDIPMFRGESLCINSTKVEFNEKLPFNLITIKNPSTSNCIYTIHNLHFDSKDSNAINLYMDNSSNEDSNSHNAQNLIIEHKIRHTLPYDLIELYEINLQKNDTIEFTYDNYAILLPGGSLIISIEKPLTNANITINWSQDEF